MSVHKNGEISKNFPLYHSKLIPIYKPPEEKKYTQGKRTKEINFYTNEHPDFFRLDSMKLNGYRNPFLDEVIKVDRNEHFDKMKSNVEQINLIDYIKSDRKLSQDPKVLRGIRSEFDIQMHKKRQQISEERKNKIRNANKHTINVDDIKNYDNILKELDKYTPKINYKMKRTIDPDENDKTIGKYFTSTLNYDKLKQLNCQFDPNKSAYISNSNDYKISEANGKDKQKEFSHQRRTITDFNLINNKKRKITPPLFNNEKWSPFYENFYMTMIKNNKGFLQKGGLFTEFTNKNIDVININKRKHKEKFLRDKLGLNFINNNEHNKVKDSKNLLNEKNIVKKSKSIKYNFAKFNKFRNTFNYSIK